MRTAALLLALAAAALGQSREPGVQRALAYLKANDAAHLAKQIEIAQIPAPTFQEERRAAFMEREFRRVGLADVSIDGQGNVLGWRRGTGGGPVFAIAAHLDTVFPDGTDVTVKRQGNRLVGPGLADDSLGLRVLLALAEALDHGGVRTRHDLLFVANVCEEGLGDLLGMKYLFEKGPLRGRIAAFISVDGSDPARIVNGAVGSKRYRTTVRGPGGHSYGNFGRANPTHALGRVMARLAGFQTPSSPKTTFNVGRIGGGTSVNSIAFEAWMEVDLRSESEAELERLEQRFLEAVRLGVDDENQFRAAAGAKLEAENKLLGVRYAGSTPADSPLVRAAEGAAQTLGFAPVLAASSTDSNVPIKLGIPAITLGGGGRAGDAHSLNEWFEPDGAYKGAQQVLLTVLGYDAGL
ncbi:MAG: M20/M25/M40 family metallo-hydrolase [Bryobacterales bacterium]|nr:M20/M25/M40 family metallo-hydrolase [Bryobacterales bacterium]